VFGFLSKFVSFLFCVCVGGGVGLSQLTTKNRQTTTQSLSLPVAPLTKWKLACHSPQRRLQPESNLSALSGHKTIEGFGRSNFKLLAASIFNLIGLVCKTLQ